MDSRLARSARPGARPTTPRGLRPLLPVTASWPLRLRIVESAHRVLQAEGVGGYFVTVKPGVWSTYTDWRKGRIQFGERMVLYSNNRRPFARMGGLRGREALLREPRAKLGVLVLHECAHALTHRRFPAARPHGREFYRTERDLLDRYLGEVVSALAEMSPGSHDLRLPGSVWKFEIADLRLPIERSSAQSPNYPGPPPTPPFSNRGGRAQRLAGG